MSCRTSLILHQPFRALHSWGMSTSPREQDKEGAGAPGGALLSWQVHSAMRWDEITLRERVGWCCGVWVCMTKDGGCLPRDAGSHRMCHPGLTQHSQEQGAHPGGISASCCPVHPVQRGSGEQLQLFLTQWARQRLIFGILLHFLTWPLIKFLASSASVSGNQAVNASSVCLALSHPTRECSASLWDGGCPSSQPGSVLHPLPPAGTTACVHWLQSRHSPAAASKEKFPFQWQPGKAFLEDESTWNLWSSGMHTQFLHPSSDQGGKFSFIPSCHQIARGNSKEKRERALIPLYEELKANPDQIRGTCGGEISL